VIGISNVHLICKNGSRCRHKHLIQFNYLNSLKIFRTPK